MFKIIYPLFRNGKNHYESLDQGTSIRNDSGESMELEIQTRTRALVICESYTQRTDRYTVIKQLALLGKPIKNRKF